MMAGWKLRVREGRPRASRSSTLALTLALAMGFSASVLVSGWRGTATAEQRVVKRNVRAIEKKKKCIFGNI